MARIRLEQLDSHVGWQPGEIVTVQVVGIDEATNTYVCDTLETFPADLKERHQAELAAQAAAHLRELADQRGPKPEDVEQN